MNIYLTATPCQTLSHSRISTPNLSLYGEFSTPLGQTRAMNPFSLGGLVGAVLGQLFCPIPFLGAMLGAAIGAMAYGMFEFAPDCCCGHMHDFYGSHNEAQSYNYGFRSHRGPRQARPVALDRFQADRKTESGSSNGSVAVETHRSENRSSTTVENPKSPDADLEVKTTVPKGGKIDSVTFVKGPKVVAETRAQNADGSSVTRQTVQATPESTVVTITDVDSTPTSSQVVIEKETVTVTNQAPTGNVVTTVDVSEQAHDGPVENFVRELEQTLSGSAGESPAPVRVEGVNQVQIQVDQEGAAVMTGSAGGQNTVIHQTAGDHDDSLLEKAGEVIDTACDYLYQGVTEVAEAAAPVINAVGGVLKRVGLWP